MHTFTPTALNKLHHLNALPWPGTFSNEGLAPQFNRWTEGVLYTNASEQILMVNPRTGRAEVLYQIGGYEEFIQDYLDGFTPDDFSDDECNQIIDAALAEGAHINSEWYWLIKKRHNQKASA